MVSTNQGIDSFYLLSLQSVGGEEGGDGVC